MENFVGQVLRSSKLDHIATTGVGEQEGKICRICRICAEEMMRHTWWLRLAEWRGIRGPHLSDPLARALMLSGDNRLLWFLRAAHKQPTLPHSFPSTKPSGISFLVTLLDVGHGHHLSSYGPRSRRPHCSASNHPLHQRHPARIHGPAPHRRPCRQNP